MSRGAMTRGMGGGGLSAASAAAALFPAWTDFDTVVSTYDGPTSPGTPPTMGNSVVEGEYLLVGKLCIQNFRITIGSTYDGSAASGYIFLSTPVQPRWVPRTVGLGEVIDQSAGGTTYPFQIKVDSAWDSAVPKIGPLMQANASNFDGVTKTDPVTLDDNVLIVGQAIFEVA